MYTRVLGVSSDRPYRSALREQQADQTRRRIRQAARELFASRGFTATTVAEIARAAGVSPATVYAVYDSKAGIVTAMLEEIEDRVGMAAKLEEVLAASDPAQLLPLFLAAHCDLFEDSADVLRAAMRAIEDPEVATLAARGDGRRRKVIEHITRRLHEAGMLRDDLTPLVAADRLWLLTTVEGYLNAVDRLGWQRDNYEAWVLQLAETELLAT
jgi:AcrR family transcriptional regulator